MYIVIRNLSANGFSWELGLAPLVVGRGQDCDIRVFDQELSRRHFKIWLQDGMAHFEDLGSSNATLINGKPGTKGTLAPGDTLGAGTTVFLICDALEALQAPLADDPDATPITLSARLESYMGAQDEEVGTTIAHRTVKELHDLFQLGRALGSVESIRGLTALLAQTLTDQFEPHALWIAWRYADDQSLLFEETASAGHDMPPPADLLNRSLNAREGMIKPTVHRIGNQRFPQTLLVAPLVHADQVLGGFALCGRAPSRTYAEDDLHYALGIASIAAPHVRAVRHAEQLRRDNLQLQTHTGFATELLGKSAPMMETRTLLHRAGGSTLPVLLLGETGTGKEIAARMVHDSSPRREGPYVVVNCAAIPDHLFESEFFGHEVGAFTGATAQRLGYFEEAHGGTLFLDEVGDLSIENQARILRVIETNAFRRVGGNKLIHVDVRIVSATNKTLEAPAFRLDLLHRLNGLTISMPALREHPEDIPDLVAHFIHNSTPHGSGHLSGIHSDAVERLQQHPWPGNVRELRAVIERATLFAGSPELSIADLALQTESVYESNRMDAQSCDNCDTKAHLPLAEVERNHIQRVITSCQGNIAEAARKLKMNRATLYRRIAEYGIK